MTGTLPKITITSDVADVVIPNGTEVTGPADWNGVIAAPTVTTVELPVTSGETKTLSAAIELGFAGEKLSFDDAVRILLPGQAGKKAGYTRDGGVTFTEITNTCATDNGDTLGVDEECKIDVIGDMVIWTRHFTTFATYTQTTNTVNHGNSGSKPATPAVPANITTPDGCAVGDKFSTTTGRNCNAATPAVGKVLGAEKFNFTKFVKFNAGSYKFSLQGAEVMELQKFLTTLGYTLTADGKFGLKTKGAVIKFQIANGLKGDGVVGPLTRAVLNKSR